MAGMIAQALRFSLVGVAATLLHVLLMVGLVESGLLAPFEANFVAFSGALLLSYLGNLRWTFGLRGRHQTHVPRFVTVALLGFLLNQAIVYGVVDLLQGDYRLALALVVLIVPALSFLANRHWAFREWARQPAGRGDRAEPVGRP
ncbi:MAG: GtrA family protein [Kiloniellales bacterium]|nr:GtrA family protein [Kiloniellales bacterium]